MQVQSFASAAQFCSSQPVQKRATHTPAFGAATVLEENIPQQAMPRLIELLKYHIQGAAVDQKGHQYLMSEIKANLQRFAPGLAHQIYEEQTTVVPAAVAFQDILQRRSSVNVQQDGDNWVALTGHEALLAELTPTRSTAVHELFRTGNPVEFRIFRKNQMAMLQYYLEGLDKQVTVNGQDKVRLELTPDKQSVIIRVRDHKTNEVKVELKHSLKDGSTALNQPSLSDRLKAYDRLKAAMTSDRNRTEPA